VSAPTSEANSLSAKSAWCCSDARPGGVPAGKAHAGHGGCCSLTGLGAPDAQRSRSAAPRADAGRPSTKGRVDEGLYRNFAEVIERVGDASLQLYLYHIPPVSQVRSAAPHRAAAEEISATVGGV